MRIILIDRSVLDFHVNAPLSDPLGGSHSALCYLTSALVQQRHSVFLFNHSKTLTEINGVLRIPLLAMSSELISSLQADVCILLNDSIQVETISNTLPINVLLILWTQHPTDQPAIHNLRDKTQQNFFDHFILISEWQKEQYIKEFGIPESQISIIRNAISPSFENLFEDDESILSYKKTLSSLTYTSTPFRGLELLLEIFPNIKNSIPESHLSIYSSMKVYQESSEEDQLKYGHLYDLCHQISGISYIGAVPQSQLAQSLKSISLLTYPNTFPETSCIAVMEAMAAGCQIISSDLGALPETTAGFAQLISRENGWDSYKDLFVKTTVDTLHAYKDTKQHQALEQKLRAQVDYVNTHYTWSLRAQEWSSLLEQVCQPSKIVFNLADTFIPRVESFIRFKDYQSALELCELASQNQSIATVVYAYWGIILILTTQEIEAQILWASYLAEVDLLLDIEVPNKIANIIKTQAKVQQELKKFESAFALYKYAQEFDPDNLDTVVNLLETVLLLEFMTEDVDIYLEQVTECLLNHPESLTPELSKILNQNFKTIFKYHYTSINLRTFVQSCSHYENLVSELFNALNYFMFDQYPEYTLPFCDVYLAIHPIKWQAAYRILNIYINNNDFYRAIEYVKIAINAASSLVEEVNSYSMWVHALSHSFSNLVQIDLIYSIWTQKINQVLGNQSNDIFIPNLHSLLGFEFITTHIFDNPSVTRGLQTQLARYYVSQIHQHLGSALYSSDLCPQRKLNVDQKLRLGFIGNCYHYHPVAFQVRAFLRYLNRELFEVYLYGYTHREKSEDPLNQWFRVISDKYFLGEHSGSDLANEIYADQVDILIDLDSTTYASTCQVMALKPAPIQVTWLGFDSTQFSTVDYFIADPYIVPEQAQGYYQEKIWRMPYVYVALDGLEVGNPSISRADLDIPLDSILYMCAQRTSKFSPEFSKVQCNILQSVPNSYLIIKYWSGNNPYDPFESLFLELVESQGISTERIRFQTKDVHDTHRANLAIADVILDTYPYAGGTTTLEALWMEIPLVTLAGQQFVSRHSYTFMMNAGVSEGIAFTPEQYIEWGIRLGTDEELRKKVSWKLKKAKQTAPLWNARQFTQEMEAALQAMWHNYVTGEMILPPGHRIG